MIQSKSDVPIDQIQIYDIAGRLVYENMSIEKSREISIDVTGLNVGMYYCKIIASTALTSIPFIKSE